MRPVTLTTDTAPARFSLRRFWRVRVVGLIVAQLKQGITYRRVALTIALGITLGVFPILGTTTTICLLAGFFLKLNQPILQFVNYLFSAAQLLLIVVFVRIGEWAMRSPRVKFSVSEMVQKFHVSPKGFMHEFWLTGLHAIEGWCLVAPWLALTLYLILLPPLKALATRQKKEVNRSAETQR